MMVILMRTLNRIIFVLSLAGVLIASYVLQSWLRHAPIVCLTGGCETVRKNPAAWPIGIPVPGVGLVGYVILSVCAFLRTMKFSRRAGDTLIRIMLGMSVFVVCFVTWFTYTELFVIHGICMWCAISTIDMYIVCALTLSVFLREQTK